MLHLEDIHKTYHAGGFEQAALDGVTITFRDNEFVAILGPSGSGKTTMLNIVGGLDHHDFGDLVIDQVSTSDYSARDWDTYRNNRIGFVFQSYNLIPHQSVLANVELALTLSGVGKAERIRRARHALDQVGLSEHIHKLPNQLSGGQMQRVAIARALINDPEILLADEPTGALDSKTGVQVMKLLQGIAQDRLVIMVTHNPELAEQYANRIVSLKDGQVVDDTHPYDGTSELRESKPARRTSMSFLTAIALSFTNLMTKKGRTLMTSFAGSIGIIGIATILALANGVNAYIRGVEEETLSQYPLSIQSQGIDLTALLVAGSGMTGNTTNTTSNNPNVAREVKMVANMFGQVGKNDLASLKTYFESPESGVDQWVSSVQYSYPLTPQIYAVDTNDGIRQVNPNRAFSSLGFSSDASNNSLISMGMSADVFSSLPTDMELVANQYDIKAGHWPQSADECVMVLMSSGGIADYALYAMGLRDPDELTAMVEQIANNEEVTPPEDRLEISYDQLLSVEFKLVEAADYYEWDPEYQVWTDRRSDEDFMKKLVTSGRTLRITGVVGPNPDASATTLTAGIYYSADLPLELMDRAGDAAIIQQQIAEPGINVFTGRSFADEAETPKAAEFDFGDFIKVDSKSMEKAFSSNLSGLDFSNLKLNIDPSTMKMPNIPPPDLVSMLSTLKIDVDPAALVTIMGQLMGDYLMEVYGPDSGNWPADWPTTFPTTFPTAVPTALPTPFPTTIPTAVPTALPTNFPWPSDPNNPGQPLPIPTPAEIADGFTAYLARPEVQAKLFSQLAAVVDTKALESQVGKALTGYLTTTMETVMRSSMGQLQTQIGAALTSSMSDLTAQMSEAFQLDPEVFRDAFKLNMDETQLTQMLMAVMGGNTKTYDANLRTLGYANVNKPSQIDIYPIDFRAKQQIIDILDAYNDRMRALGAEDRVITYTDIVGTLMTSVTDIIDKISAVMVAFVSISLIVSSIMIGVITYISVLERKKEIGILRAMGASKADIGNVFNAETLIVGFVAGLMGVLVTLLLTVIANPIVYDYFDVDRIARLPLDSAVILVAVSMVLTFLAGLIPSSAASRKDPVEALRSE